MNKNVIVTGASRGIGRQIATEFSSLGYNVCINYNKSKKEALELEIKLKKLGHNVISYKADVSKRDEVDMMVDHVLKHFGSVDVLINNAGICQYDLFTDITETDFREMLDTTVIGTFNTTQAVLKKHMLDKKSGCIINISSMWGIVGGSCEVSYSTAKAGIIGMTKSLAKELALSNIRVNAVAPGCISTDMMKDFSKEELNQIKSEIPLNRIGTPEEVAGVVTFLASNKANYITGQIISPNGGMVI